MLASTWMDMVVGVDFHFEMVIIPPAPPVPTPFPNPFIGIVIDPAGLAIGLALGAALALATGGTPTGPVMINSMFATNVGTEAKGMGHMLIPPGSMWVPMPKFPKLSFRGPPEFPGPPVKPEDDAVSIMGSTTVTVMGTSAVRMGEMWMSCGEPLRLPSSVVIAIPKGPLVLIGGPPGVNLLDALLGMIKTKWVAGYLHSAISRIKSDRLRNILNKAACFLTGHPVDVASGRMLTDNVDFELPGPLPLKFERNYASSWSHRDGPLGPGWSHSLDQAVWLERGKIVYLADDGREIEFDVFDFPDHMLQIGQEVYEPINQLTLRLKSRELIEIETHSGETLEFVAPARPDASPRGYWWRLQKRRTRDRHEILFSYDERNNLQWVRDSGGRIIGFEHNADNRLTRVKLPHPTADGFIDYLHYFYDAEGDLIQVTDALGASWTFAYKRHLMVRETNRNGLSFYFAYDGYGSDAYCVRTWGDGGIYDHVIDYAKGQMTVVTNSLGHKTAYKLNPIGQVVEVIDARGGTTKYEYDERTLKKTKETDPLGGETKTEYDARGNVTKIVRADGTSTLVQQGAFNRPELAVDPLSGEWHWTYDRMGRLTCQTNPLNERTQLVWGDTGLIAITDAAGEHIRVTHDSAGNLSSVTFPDGNSVSSTYDRLGRQTSQADVNGNLKRWQHDVLGRLTRVDEVDGNVREFQYDAEGSVVWARDRHYDVRSRYSGMSRLVVREQATSFLRFRYDTEERLVAIENEQGHVYHFQLDAVGRVQEEVGFDGIRRCYVRDNAGRVEKALRPGGSKIEYTYDAVGRVIAVAYSDGSREAFSYRADGAMQSAENDEVRVFFEHDALGRVTKESVGEHWVASEYDSLGLRRGLRSSSGFCQRTRRNSMSDVIALEAEVRELGDASPGSIASAEQHKSVSRARFNAAFERDPFGMERERSLPGGVALRWQRDSIGRPLHSEIWSGSHVHSAKRYQWDVNDRMLSVMDAMTGPVAYEHDSRGSLTAATYADGHVDFRVTDSVGNIFRTHDRSDREYGSGGQLLETKGPHGTTFYEYDLVGNLIRKVEMEGGTWEYRWNDTGMLVCVVRPDGEAVQFAYDALGRRVSKKFGGVLTRWVWDANLPLHQWRESTGDSGTKHGSDVSCPEPAHGASVMDDGLTTWVFEPESFSPLAKMVGEESFGIVGDHVGSPSAMFDDRGNLAWGADINVHGELHNLHGRREDCPFRWPGQEEDVETGLYYNRFRYYDPNMGQYTSQDPIRLGGGVNLYSYPFDPLTAFDPFGLIVVYRLLRANENPASGLAAKRPGRDMTVHGHVSSGSRNKGSQFISTSTDPAALAPHRAPGQRMVSFDTDDIVADAMGNKRVIDISTVAKAEAAGVGSVSAKMAAASKEVLVEGQVPPQAITECK